MDHKILNQEQLKRMDAYFRALNYVSVGQLYLKDNPLLKEPLKLDHIKPSLVGHWGTVPGQNFIYMHLNRLIKDHNLNMFYISGPGHGGNAMVANTYFEGTYSDIYPNISEDMEGLKKLFKQFSFPGGISSHVAPETPGSINEGGELGYSLVHAFGAVLDNPNLIAACVVGDGEAETGTLAASWHLNKLINKDKDGVVLPILHLNGYKIANPSVFARIPESELMKLFEGYGWKPYFVEYKDSIDNINQEMARALENAYLDIVSIKKSDDKKRPIWPMLILKTPKGWTGPKVVEGNQIENTYHAHQIPIVISKEKINNLKLLEEWLKSYRPEELFTETGKLIPELKQLLPPKELRMGANLNANGGRLLKELRLPDFKKYGIEITKRGKIIEQDMSILGNYIKDIIKLNEDSNNFRIFGPDELTSNRLNKVFDVTKRQWQGEIIDIDDNLSTTGRVVDSFLSENICEGLLEGYLLTGRHGFFHSYEAFIRIIDSMTSQHAKWLKVTKELPWRAHIASLNYVLSSHIWQQDHNGYTHQNPGFLNHLVTNKADIVRIYLPYDANSLLSCFDHTIKSKNYINVIVASKHPRPQWLTMEETVKHCTHGISIWKFASTDNGEEPDLIMACAGDTPTLEALAATKILKENFNDLKIRFVNVVDLMKIQSEKEHPHGLSEEDYNTIFTKNKPIIFAFHGYPNLIHQLSYKRENQNLHVHGYLEEGTITTPFDMRVQNKIDRFNLVINAIKYLPELGNKGAGLIQWCKDKLVEHKEYIKEYGQDLDEIKNWNWED